MYEPVETTYGTWDVYYHDCDPGTVSMSVGHGGYYNCDHEIELTKQDLENLLSAIESAKVQWENFVEDIL